MIEIKPSEILNPKFDFDFRQKYRLATLEVSYYPPKAEAINLRRSEALQYAKRYAEKLIEHMKLPKELSVKIELQDSPFGYCCARAIIKDPDNPASEHFEAKWSEFLTAAFEKAKEPALAELGDPEVHDHEGNVISGSHVKRAKDSKGSAAEIGG